jgi:hypothetical protein
MTRAIADMFAHLKGIKRIEYPLARAIELVLGMCCKERLVLQVLPFSHLTSHGCNLFFPAPTASHFKRIGAPNSCFADLEARHVSRF